jgi:hypothetical protein
VKKIAVFCFLLAGVLQAAAIPDGQVRYVGGTVPRLSQGVVGRLDITSETALKFEYSAGKLEIPYAAIESFEYSQPVARHLGVLPAIVVALVRRRQHRHLYRISYHDENGRSQVAIFEVPKQMPRTLQPSLETRAPQGCKPLWSAEVSARCKNR